MKLYSTLDVDFTYQNFGSAWLGILRGATENVQTAFNGLFNYCATNGEMQFRDHLEMLSIFWTDRRAMRRFFFNQYYMPRCEGNSRKQHKLARAAMRYAHDKLDMLSETSHEFYLNFANKFSPETYSSGQITAERPDNDMKDAILAHAFADKDSATTAQKVVDSE